MVWVWFVTAALAATVHGVDHPRELGTHPGRNLMVVEAVVLAENAQYTAYRRTIGAPFTEQTCTYPGLETSDRGVELGLIHRDSGDTLETWVVHAPAGSPFGCTPEWLAKARLDAAKARFKALGLDLAAQPPRLMKGPPPSGLETYQEDGVDIIRLEMLAHRGDLAAYRAVTKTGRRAQAESARCGYAGLEEPSHGVRLGIAHLPSGRTVEEWSVYHATDSEQYCTPHARSKLRLAAAKARFAALGLNLDRRPPTRSLPSLGLRVATREEQVPTDSQHHETIHEVRYFVKRGNTTVYSMWGQYRRSPMGADVFAAQYPQAYELESATVLVECLDFVRKTCRFTPPIPRTSL